MSITLRGSRAAVTWSLAITAVLVAATAATAAPTATKPPATATRPQAAALVAATGCPGAPSWLAAAAQVHTPGTGVTVRTWNGHNRAGAPVRIVVAQGDRRYVTMKAATSASIGVRAPTTAIVAAARGLAGVNGGYFATVSKVPQPTGAQIASGVVLRLPAGSTPMVGVGVDGHVRSGSVHPSGSVTLAARPGIGARWIAVTAVNPSLTSATGVTVVTRYGTAVPLSAARWVVVRAGVVTYDAATKPTGAAAVLGANDFMLLAPSTVAPVLATAVVGSSVASTWAGLADDDTVLRDAVSSSGPILAGGVTQASCTTPSGRTSRPRTMVAWTAKQDRVLLVTVNSTGTGTWAPGLVGLQYTEMAGVAHALGATEAVLVDGGGSTTLAERLGTVVERVDVAATVGQRPVGDILYLQR